MAVVLLAAGIVLLFVRPPWLPIWAGPVAAASAGVATGVIRWHVTADALRLLRNPLLFLLFAVPLAVLLDRIGVFSALAARVSGGRHLVLWLWVLAAGVTAVFNLDAAVVLLTPLYIHIAKGNGYAPEMLAFQPALMACLASNPLPVSNLTNLIVAEKFGLGVGQFVVHLLLPTVLACSVGWFAYRRYFGTEPQQRRHSDAAVGAPDPGGRQPVDEANALRRGLPIVGFVLLGFTLGDALGIPGWVVAAVAVLWASALTRMFAWRVVPYAAMLVAVGLSVLVAGAVPHLGLDRLLDATGIAGRLRAFGFGVVGSNVSNNLPAVLAGSAALEHQASVWALLIGVNVGPVLVISGALSGLLWRDTAARFDVHITAKRYSQVGLRVGLPALLVAGAAVVLL